MTLSVQKIRFGFIQCLEEKTFCLGQEVQVGSACQSKSLEGLFGPARCSQQKNIKVNEKKII